MRYIIPALASLSAVALLLALYTCLYLSLVRQKLFGSENIAPGVMRLGTSCSAGGDLAEFVFWPANTIDRRLRPSTWEMHYYEGPTPLP